VALFFNYVLPVLVGISIVALIVFLLRALSARSKMSSQAYGVGQVETRQKAQANLLAAVVFLVLALIFLLLIFVGPRVMASFPDPTPTPEPTTIPATAVPTVTSTATSIPTPMGTTPTSPVPTATGTALPTETPTPSPQTATVSSGVGIYLRSEPGTDSAELQYLEDGTILFVLDNQQTAEDLLWQQVQTDTGQVGWVAVDYITVNNP
jgi:uncharacterized protein YgiM (DUF1202 family)